MWATALIVAWDCSFSLLRPASLNTASPLYSRLFYPYQTKYQFVDKFYAAAPAGSGADQMFLEGSDRAHPVRKAPAWITAGAGASLGHPPT